MPDCHKYFIGMNFENKKNTLTLKLLFKIKTSIWH